MVGMQHRTTVVIATRDRRRELAVTLDRLLALPERPPVVVVDNGSVDGTADVAERRAGDGVTVVRAGTNLGAAGRTIGAELATTRHVAFSDDDSWWAPGALGRAADVLDGDDRLAVVAARVLVGDDEREDPVCRAMAASPLPQPEPPTAGPLVLGFVACGAIVRRDAFLAAGGFHRAYGVGGEEELLALDLAAAGHLSAYVDDVVAHHHPSSTRDPERRRRVQLRNALWTAWLRRPLPAALIITGRALATARRERWARGALVDAIGGAGWVARQRRAVPRDVERNVRLLQR
jgi:GT2 family glycosyltransferase